MISGSSDIKSLHQRSSGQLIRQGPGRQVLATCVGDELAQQWQRSSVAAEVESSCGQAQERAREGVAAATVRQHLYLIHHRHLHTCVMSLQFLRYTPLPGHAGMCHISKIPISLFAPRPGRHVYHNINSIILIHFHTDLRASHVSPSQLERSS